MSPVKVWEGLKLCCNVPCKSSFFPFDSIWHFVFLSYVQGISFHSSIKLNAYTKKDISKIFDLYLVNGSVCGFALLATVHIFSFETLSNVLIPFAKYVEQTSYWVHSEVRLIHKCYCAPVSALTQILRAPLWTNQPNLFWPTLYLNSASIFFWRPKAIP